MGNRGEEKLRVHINVVLRSSMNINSKVEIKVLCEAHERLTAR